ncbi:hypothetical protein BC835DRAFT_962914 [Cytidiella melzeri]|nr:hypothetical protein BC835DRAFT_962914 [Cytidiella melzeri]
MDGPVSSSLLAVTTLVLLVVRTPGRLPSGLHLRLFGLATRKHLADYHSRSTILNGILTDDDSHLDLLFGFYHSWMLALLISWLRLLRSSRVHQYILDDILDHSPYISPRPTWATPDGHSICSLFGLSLSVDIDTDSLLS